MMEKLAEQPHLLTQESTTQSVESPRENSMPPIKNKKTVAQPEVENLDSLEIQHPDGGRQKKDPN